MKSNTFEYSARFPGQAIQDKYMTNAVLQNSSLHVEVMPALGGKIASIRLLPGGEELLQQPLLPYAVRTKYMRFDDSDASGWDECLPSVAACEVPTPTGGASIPDHGDFWQTEWKIEEQKKESLTLSSDGFSLPLRFIKTLALKENTLRTTYRVENKGTFTVEYVWSAHPLFAVDPGDRILLPPSVKEVILEGSAGNRLGTHGAKHPWPGVRLVDGSSCNLSVTGEITDGTGDKLFAAAPAEGWCALERVALKKHIELRFDPQALPWLGLWLCYGGWPETKANRQHCVALEPCMALGDSLAIASREKRAKTLHSGNEHTWSVDLLVKGVS